MLLDDATFDLLLEAGSSLAQAKLFVEIAISKVCVLSEGLWPEFWKQFAKDFETEWAPFQYALSTRAGTDCVGHIQSSH